MHDATAGNELALGLVANGSAGSWDVAVDETTTGEQRWFVQIEGAVVSLYFEIDSPRVVDTIVHFLEQRAVLGSEPSGSATADERVSVGRFGQYAVLLRRDSEYEDRCFFVIGPSANSTIWIGLVGKDIALLTAAFRQARDDLQESGLL